MTQSTAAHGSGSIVSSRRGLTFLFRVFALGALILVPALLLVPPGAAYAGDDEDAKAKAEAAKQLEASFEKLTDSIEAHKKAFDLDGLKEDLANAAGLFNEADGHEDLQLKVLKEVGSMTRGSKDPPLAIAMLQTLADVGDPRGAKYIKPYLKQRDKKESSELLQVAVASAGEVPDDSLAGPLLKIVTDSKTPGIVGDAVDALARYRKCKKVRNKIVDTLLKEMKKCKPGGKPRMRGVPQTPADGGSGGGGEGTGYLGQGDGGNVKWPVLAGRVPRALNDMTGQDMGGAEDWLDAYKAYKGKYDSLFTED